MTTHALTTLNNSSAIRLTPNGIHSGMDITIQNLNDTEYVYIGGQDVNLQDFGYRIAPGAAWSVELSGNDALYAIASAELSVAILTTNLESGN